MPAKKSRVKMQCTVCKTTNYFVNKTKAVGDKKMEFSKFCNTCKKHTSHKESKK